MQPVLSFVAKSSVYHATHLDGLIEKAIRKKGFSVVEALSNCHIQYGRRNKMGSPVKMIEWFKENTIRAEAAAKLSPEEVQGKIMIGVLADRDRPSYEEEYALVRSKAQAKAKR